jgi:ubiquinone/menaquinone biosynthesis C-methylase UbiE
MMDVYHLWVSDDGRLRHRPHLQMLNLESRAASSSVYSWLTFLLASPEKASMVLDVGCGWGREIIPICAKSARTGVCAVDLGTLGLRAAGNLTRGLKNRPALFRSSAYALPFREGLFDVLISSEVLEHLVYPTRFLKEANRVLKEGGKLVLQTPDGWVAAYSRRIVSRLASWFALFSGHIARSGDQEIRGFAERQRAYETALKAKYSIASYDFHLYSVAEVLSLLQSSGFEVRKLMGSTLQPHAVADASKQAYYVWRVVDGILRLFFPSSLYTWDIVALADKRTLDHAHAGPSVSDAQRE